MPKTQVTYGQLLALRDDIIRQQKNSAAFYFFNKTKVDKFFAVNTMALKVMQSRLDEYVTKYVKFDRDGQPVKEERDGKEYYCFYSDDFKEKYQNAVNKFLSLKISIEL